MYFIKVVLISLALLINKNSCAQPEGHKSDQNEVEKCSSDKKVCGKDGKTYNNICLLQKETGVKLAHEGDCKSGKNGKKKIPYIPDLILKSKIVNTTEESVKKKLVKHFNPTTGKWEYVIDILPTIVITPTFHQLQMADQASPYNISNIKIKTIGPVNGPNNFRLNNLPFLGKPSGGMYPKSKLIIDNSQGPFNRNNNIIQEIVGNVTNNFPRTQVENTDLLPMENETIPSIQEPLPGNRTGKLKHVASPLKSLKPQFKNVYLKKDSISNHTKEVQSTENRTLPEKPTTEGNKSLKLPKVESVKIKNGSLDAPNNEMLRTPLGNATKTAGNISPKLLIYKDDNRRKTWKTNLLEKAKKPHKKHQIPIKANSTLRAPHVMKPYAVHHYKPHLPGPRVMYRNSEPKNMDHEINNVFKAPHKNVSSPYPTTVPNTTHTALNISQPIMNNLTHSISPKMPEYHQKPVANVTEEPGKEKVPLISSVSDSVVNISQPISNPTGAKPFPKKDEYNSMMNDSRPIKKGPVSGNLLSGKLNSPPNKPEEIPKIMPNNRSTIHRIPSFHPGHSKLSHSAVSVPKSHGWIPPKNIPSIIENKEEITDQTKPNTDAKPNSNTKWGTYYIKLPGNVSDYIDLVINWEVLQSTTNQPNLTINVSEVIGSKNYTWPKDTKYATDTSAYHKLRSGILKPINEKTQRIVNKDVWHNTNSKHPQFLVNTRKPDDVPINVTKSAEIKSYQLEDEMTLQENMKSGLSPNWRERKVGAYRYVKPALQVMSKKFGHNLEKHGSYSLDVPSNLAGNFKLIFSWTLKNKLPKSIRTPIDVTEKQVKYDYKWKIGGNNKGGQPIGNEEIQPIKSVNVTANKTVTPMKHSFGERGLIGRKIPTRRLHNLVQRLGNVHLDIPKITTKPQLNTTSPSVKTEKTRPATNLYPGWYYMEMLFNVPGGGSSANSNNYINQNNYSGDPRKSQKDPTELLTFDKSISSLLPIDHPSFLNKYAIEHLKAPQDKCNCDKDKTKS